MIALLVTALAVSCACSAAAGSVGPQDQRLAVRIAPIASDLGSSWRQESSAAAHAQTFCPPRTSGCVYRFFVLPGDPAFVPRATALVQVFAGAAKARSAYTTVKRKASATRTIDKSGVQQTISLCSEKNLAAGEDVPRCLCSRSR